MPNVTFFALVLAAFEMTTGILILGRGKFAKFGLAASVLFNLFLMQLGHASPQAGWKADLFVNRLPNLPFILPQLTLFWVHFDKSVHRASGRSPALGYCTRQRRAQMLTGIKLLHTLIWAFLALSILVLPVVGVLRKFRRAAILTGLVLVECGVLALNGGRCPLSDLAARFTNDRAHNFDIYLPNWLAQHNKVIFGVLFVAGELVVLGCWLVSCMRRQPIGSVNHAVAIRHPAHDLKWSFARLGVSRFIAICSTKVISDNR